MEVMWPWLPDASLSGTSSLTQGPKSKGEAGKGIRPGRILQEGSLAARGRDDPGESSVKLLHPGRLCASQFRQGRASLLSYGLRQTTPISVTVSPPEMATDLKTRLAGRGWQTGSGPRGHRHTDIHSAPGQASTQGSGHTCAKKAFQPHLQ